jgi:hypothetical protein
MEGSASAPRMPASKVTSIPTFLLLELPPPHPVIKSTTEDTAQSAVSVRIQVIESAPIIIIFISEQVISNYNKTISYYKIAEQM